MPKESAKTTITEFTSTPLVRVVDGTLSRNMSPANLAADQFDSRYAPFVSDLNGDGVTDDAATIQAAIDTAAARDTAALTYGGTVRLPPGTFLIESTIEIEAQALTIQGSGPATVIAWGGAADSPMFQVVDSARVEFTDMTIIGDDTNEPSAGIYCASPVQGTRGTNEFIAVRRVMFGRNSTDDPTITGELKRGVQIGGASNTNNDTWTVEDCQFHDCTVAGLSVDNAQHVWGNVRNAYFGECATAVYARGSLQLWNAQFNRSSVVDINVDNCNVVVFGMYSEHALKLWEQGTAAGLAIYGGRCLLQAEAGDPWATSAVSSYRHLILHGLQVVDSGATGDPVLAINGSSSDTDPAYVTIRSCELPNGDSDAGYEINGYAAGTPLHVDIKQGTYWRNQVVQELDAASSLDIGDYLEAPPKPVATVGGYLAEGAEPTAQQMPVADTMLLAPIQLPAGTFDRFTINVSTAAASSVVRCGLYDVAASGLPGDLLVESTALDTSTTGEKTYDFSTDLVLDRPGWYYIGAVAQVGRPTLNGRIGYNTIVPSNSLELPAAAYAKTGVSGALPSSFGAFAGTTTNAPLVCLRRSA